MTAFLTKQGRLVIQPDNQTEAYALKQWSENYLRGDEHSCLSVEWDKPDENETV